MKNYLIIAFALISLSSKSQNFFDSTDKFLTKYVSDGKVNYDLIKKDPKMLNDLVKEIADHDLTNKRVSSDYMKAFYINAYNILVIKQVVEHYPIYGPLKVDGFFDGIKNNVMGQNITLNELEKETLYKDYPDPRLHFVLVCAAKGCPPLASTAFQPENLEALLQKRTKHVLNLDWFIRVKKSNIEISQIFNWYASDFEKKHGSVKSFLNIYRNEKIGDKQKIKNYEYDWSLNE